MNQTDTTAADDLQFGIQLTPTLDVEAQRRIVDTAEADGLDLVGVQDHPYVPTMVDALTLIAELAGRTQRLRFFPDVASLPLRPAPMLAKVAASLDHLSGGRFELGLGAGGYWSAITALGAEHLSPPERVAALREAVEVLRAAWRANGTAVRHDGPHYRIAGVRTGPAPAHPIGIWLGAQGPRTLRLTGEVADGWAAPIAPYLPYEQWPWANALIDEAAEAAGRHARAVVRIAQLVGSVDSRPGDLEVDRGDAPVRGTAEQWSEVIVRLATEQPFRTFVFWPEHESPEQVHRFATEVVPRVRERLAVHATS